MQTIRTDKEVEDLENRANETKDDSKFSGMSYEDGIVDTISWLRGDITDDLLE